MPPETNKNIGSAWSHYAVLCMFFMGCMLGSATGLRNTSLALMVWLAFSQEPLAGREQTVVRTIFTLISMLLLVCLPGAFSTWNMADFLRLAQGSLAAVLVFVVGLQFGRTQSGFFRALACLSAGLAVLAAISLLMPWTSSHPSSIGDFVAHWYPWWGVASSISVLAFPLLFLLLRGDLPRRDRRVLWVIAASIFVILIMAQNRASIFIIGSVILLALFPFRHRMNRKLSLLLVACLVVLSGVLYFKMSQKMEAYSDKARFHGSLMSQIVNDPRISGWAFWLDKGSQMSWYGFGHGKRNLGQVLSNVERADPRLWDAALTTHAHNMLLNFWLRAGYPGLGIFLILWIGLFQLFKGGQLCVWQQIGVALVGAMFLKNMTDDFFEPPVSLLFFFWLGALRSRMFYDMKSVGSCNKIKSAG